MNSAATGCACLECAAMVVLGLVALRVVWSLWNLFNVYFLGSYPNFAKLGDWSVVTGATDGIGLAFARELAKKGQNIVLISRSKDKLEDMAKDIETKYQVSTKIISADFSRGDIYDEIAGELKNLNIGVLVNNVGISYDHPEYFLEIADLSSVVDKMISINIAATVKMTEIVLPAMAAKKRGVILNLSSGAAVQPTPLLCLYSASKQFVDCFSKTLNQEYASKGVIVQCIMPYYVTTKLSKIRRSSLFVPNPQKFVSSALKTVGKASRSHGYFAHALEGMVYGLLPESLYMWAAMKANSSIRKKALKRKAAKKE